MTEYSYIIKRIAEEGLSFSDVDRIELHEDTYNDFKDRSSSTTKTSDYATIDGPSVRVTHGPERIVWVDDGGIEHRVEI